MKKVHLSNQEMLNIFNDLHAMLSAGIPILEAVNSILEESKGQSKILMTTIKDDLMQGKNISESLTEYKTSFDPVTINILKAGEESGNLEETLKIIQDNIKNSIEFNDKIKAALAYPVIVSIVFIFVILVILIYVVPKISQALLRLHVTLPLPTKIMFSASNILLTYPLEIIFFLILIGTAIYLTYKKQKKLLLRLVFSLPVLSTLQRDIDITRFARSMGMMVSSGIPIIEAVDLSDSVVTKKEVSDAIRMAKSNLSSGGKLSEGLKKNKTIPSLMIRILEAGEKSGTLDKSMLDLADHYDYEVSKRLKSFTTLLEPVLMVLIGLTIGGIMISIIAPIYQLIGNIRPQ